MAGTSQQLQRRYADSMMNTFGPPKLVLARGEGCYVWDADGNRYLDLLAGIAVNALGHAHPALVRAVTEQLQTLGHVSNFFATEPQVALAEKLLSLLRVPAADGKVFFANSGTEANEAALKLTRRTGRTHLVAMDGSFHGRSMGSLALTSKAAYREPFEPLPGDVTFVPYGDPDALAAAVTDRTAAVVVEPVQGEAGVVPAPDGFLARARDITARHGALLWLDEIQSGMGRTGALFSYMQKGIVPDILTSAKGLGGGFPVGAMLTTADIASAFSVGVHGTTYGGNPLACAVAGAVFDVINTTEVLDGVKARHALFMEGLRAINARRPVFRDLRGEGVWIGCELADAWRGKAADVVKAAGAAGLLVLMAGPDVVRIAPSLVISLDEILEGLARLESALNRALA
jgi:acetylornithine/N-succinyldiaminopimelate aminotransferase